jgi:hypothetical protein
VVNYFVCKVENLNCHFFVVLLCFWHILMLSCHHHFSTFMIEKWWTEVLLYSQHQSWAKTHLALWHQKITSVITKHDVEKTEHHVKSSTKNKQSNGLPLSPRSFEDYNGQIIPAPRCIQNNFKIINSTWVMPKNWAFKPQNILYLNTTIVSVAMEDCVLPFLTKYNFHNINHEHQVLRD